MSGTASLPAARLGNVARGVAIVAVTCLLITSGVYLYLHVSRLRPQVSLMAFASATTDLRAPEEIRLDNSTVARIDSLRPTGLTVGIGVARSGVAEIPALVTLTVPDGSVQVAEDLSAQLYHDRHVSIAIASDTIMLNPAGDRRWQLVRSPRGLEINGHEGKAGEMLPANSVLAMTRFTVRLAGIQMAMRAWIGVDTLAVAKVLKHTGRSHLVTSGILSLLGPGSRVEAGSGLGLTKGGLHLQLSPFGQPPSWVNRPVPEIVFVETSDLAETLQALAGYLTNPSAIYAEPTNRFERAIDDANGALSEVRLMAQRATSTLASLQGTVTGDGWLARAAFDTTRYAHVNAAIDSVTRQVRENGVAHVLHLDATLTTIAHAFVAMDSNVTNHVDSVSALVTRQLTSQDSLSLVDRVGAAVDTIRPQAKTTLAHGDTALAAATGTFKAVKVVGLVAVPVLLLSVIHRIAHFP